MTALQPAPAADLLPFTLPARLEAGEPPEARGLRRDQVRLLVSYGRGERLHHARFDQLPRFLQPGDVLVINTSGTLNAALPASDAQGRPRLVHLSTRYEDDCWTLELRRPAPDGHEAFRDARPGQQFELPAGGRVILIAPADREVAGASPARGVRLWQAAVDWPAPWQDYLAQHGRPIRYNYVKQTWPARYYQTVFANEPGSAEMPSAGRAFTPALITRLIAGGVQFAPLLLHTGVASLEEGEAPYAERYRVPAATARLVNDARRAGGRVIAVGTTAVRALETQTDAGGRVTPGEGWTDLVITPERGLWTVDGLLTGFHEPRASHLQMLAAITAAPALAQAYEAAVAGGYLWHEFGDLHLILPGGGR